MLLGTCLLLFFGGGGHSLDAAIGDVGDGEAPVAAADVDGHHHLAELEHVAVGAAHLQKKGLRGEASNKF